MITLMLIRCKSCLQIQRWVSLEEYVSRMPDWQKSIFYISGESTEVSSYLLAKDFEGVSNVYRSLVHMWSVFSCQSRCAALLVGSEKHRMN